MPCVINMLITSPCCHRRLRYVRIVVRLMCMHTHFLANETRRLVCQVRKSELYGMYMNVYSVDVCMCVYIHTLLVELLIELNIFVV